MSQSHLEHGCGPTSNMHSEDLQLNNSHRVVECNCQREYEENVHQMMKNYFSVENFGVQIPESLNFESKDNE